MMRKKVPDIGYTGVCWVDAFTCMYRLYLDFIEHDQAGIGDGWEREIREYIRPVFPAFDLNAYIYGEANSVERQMDVLLNIIGAVSEDYLQVRLSVVWQNASEKQLTMKAMFDEGWKAVTFGSDQIMMDWCRKRFEEGYWMGNPVRGIGPDSVKFLMGDLKAELRRTPEGMDLYLSKEGTRVQSLRLMSRERRWATAGGRKSGQSSHSLCWRTDTQWSMGCLARMICRLCICGRMASCTAESAGVQCPIRRIMRCAGKESLCPQPCLWHPCRRRSLRRLTSKRTLGCDTLPGVLPSFLTKKCGEGWSCLPGASLRAGSVPEPMPGP